MPTLSIKCKTLEISTHVQERVKSYRLRKKTLFNVHIQRAAHFLKLPDFRFPAYTERHFLFIQNPETSATRLSPYKLYVHNGN